MGAGTEAAAGVEWKMKKRKVEAKEVLRPFISLKGRREGPLGVGGVLGEDGKGVRLGAIEMVKLRKLSRKVSILMDFRRAGFRWWLWSRS